MGANKTSRKKAIDSFCKGCIYDPSSGLGTWRQQVAQCKITICELYDFRPLPIGMTHEQAALALLSEETQTIYDEGC